MKEIDIIYALHHKISGPYDDLACEHCTNLASWGREDSLEPIYISYPCLTIRLIEALWEPLEHPVKLGE